MSERASKSKQKREADALQQIGIGLIELSNAKLSALPLTEQLKEAVVEARSLKSHGAIRRQAQYIGKLMRAADGDAITNAYEQMLEEDKAQTANFHEVEQWREKLIAEGKSALTEFIATYPNAEPQQVRQLIKKAISEQEKSQHTGASKQLFRYLRSLI